VLDRHDFLAALRVAAGETVVDPALVASSSTAPATTTRSPS